MTLEPGVGGVLSPARAPERCSPAESESRTGGSSNGSNGASETLPRANLWRFFRPDPGASRPGAVSRVGDARPRREVKDRASSEAIGSIARARPGVGVAVAVAVGVGVGGDPAGEPRASTFSPAPRPTLPSGRAGRESPPRERGVLRRASSAASSRLRRLASSSASTTRAPSANPPNGSPSGTPNAASRIATPWGRSAGFVDSARWRSSASTPSTRPERSTNEEEGGGDDNASRA